MNKPNITIKPACHKGFEVIQIFYERNEQINQILRKIDGLRWSRTMNCWYLPYMPATRKALYEYLQGHADLDYSAFKKKIQYYPPDQNFVNQVRVKNEFSAALAPISIELLKKVDAFKMWMKSRRYSANTIETYADALKTYVRYFSKKDISDMDHEDLVEFNNAYILKNELSASFQNQVVNAVKLFFKVIEHKQIDLELIHRPKRAKVLPNVLSKEEVKLILGSLNNIKHKTMLSLIYSCGLRCGELLSLKPDDIDARRGLIIIRMAKGRKDRIVPLSMKIFDLLKVYLASHSPERYLFEGMVKGEPYDNRSLQQVIKSAVQKAGIEKPVTLHWLRHSYATHLLESGTDLRYIQEILGHRSSKTTKIYTHVSSKSIQQIVSPFDSL